MIYPDAMFLPGSSLEPIDEKMNLLVEGLTQWEPEVQETGIRAPEKITVTAKAQSKK